MDENLAMGELQRDFRDMMGFDLIVTNGIIVCFQFLYFFLSKFAIELKKTEELKRILSLLSQFSEFRRILVF